MKTQYSKKQILKLAGFGSLALILGLGVTGAFASNNGGQSVQERIQSLLSKLQSASQQEQKSGQLADTPQGKVFAGESAQKMEKLHNDTQAEIDALIARPESERQQAVSEIKQFADKQDLAVNYKNTSKSSYNANVSAEIYTTAFDQYEVDARNNQIIQFGPKPLEIGQESKKFDTTARYSKAELETMARQFISKNAPGVNVDNLTQKIGDKDGINYFFRWEDTTREIEDMHPLIQVGFSRGGDLLSYTNSLGL